MANEVSQQRRYIRLLGKIIYIFCAIGILLSVYALYVEIHAEGDSNFKAWCDINSRMSCSKVFTSRYVHVSIDLFTKYVCIQVKMEKYLT